MIKIKNLGERGEIEITGIVIDDTDANWLDIEDGKVIGYTYPEAIKTQLEELKGKPIDVHIASDGGDVGAGIAIYNMLISHDAPVTAYIDKWAASIASYICFSASKIVMPKGSSFMMIHNPKAGMFGDASELRSVADWLEKLQNMLAETYAKFSTKTIDEIKSLMDKETWLTADECKELFGDKIEVVDGGELRAVACYSAIKSAPKEIVKPVNDHNNVIVENILQVIKRSFENEEKG